VEFFQTGSSRVRVSIRSPCHLGYQRWSKKLEFVGYCQRNLDDPTVISFESIPVCDGQTDRETDRQTDKLAMPMSQYSIAVNKSFKIIQ